jgi:hypothetical protein
MPGSQRPQRYTETTFERQDVLLDGTGFSNCTFRRCRMIYTGEAVPRFEACDVEDRVELVLSGPAANTMKLLSLLYHAGGSGGRETVERVVDQLIGGHFQPDGDGATEAE